MAAHELRNPIAQIATTNYLLSKIGPLNEKQMELLDRINFSLERMQALIVDLDDISRLETGNIRVEMAELNLVTLVHKMVESFAEDVFDKKHELVVNVPEDLPLIWADRDRMIQVFTNLLGNAIKYTPDGGKITIKAVYLPQHHTVHISVKDTGLGIQVEDQKQIFSRFFRSEDAMVQARPGTGLGLYITKSLVEMQNGRIWFNSKYGEGTAFHFTISTRPPDDYEQIRGMETAVPTF